MWSNAEIHEWANSGGLGCGARTCPTTLGVFPVFFRDCAAQEFDTKSIMLLLDK